uniref:Uncharacterized protein n=1 Tax=Anguilla anguilla TaxID=7936 RepID=A0A0E9SWE7_ANGAN
MTFGIFGWGLRVASSQRPELRLKASLSRGLNVP